ncbi:MAG: hypothetical protein ACXWFJ_00995 [Candidatus Aminicenantales bacterium]
MKKPLKITLIALAALCVLAGTASPQAPKKADIVGTWVGTAVVGDGSKIDITAVIEKAATGYSGKLSDASGQVPESQLKEIVFKDNKLSFDFDFAQGSETVLIKIELTLEAETLKGFWFDPDGNSGEIELALKK